MQANDSLISGRHFRALAVLDQWSRESLAIEVDVSLTGERVTPAHALVSDPVEKLGARSAL